MAKKTVKHEKAQKTLETNLTGLTVALDFPQQDEGVNLGGYTFRIGSVPQAEKVEISIDRGPWLACRQAEGFWWYDWSEYASGVHRVTARAMGADGTAGVSPQRRFQVAGA